MLQSQLSMAVADACKLHRQSLVSAATLECRAHMQTADKSSDVEDVKVAVRKCAIKSHHQHRQSILQAAEVIELAKIREETGALEDWGAKNLTPAQLADQLQMVQQAIQGAWQHHCRSNR